MTAADLDILGLLITGIGAGLLFCKIMEQWISGEVEANGGS